MSATTAENVVHDLPEQDYHAHPALSSSGARRLLPPYCPAVFDWERNNPSGSSSTLDLGSAAHKLVLGAGLPIRVVDAPDWRTKAARQERDEARAADEIPLLPHEHEQVQDMAKALALHPVARQLFEDGTPELSLFWRDGRSGVDCRARIDWLTDNVLGEPVIVDYKTTVSADPATLRKSIARYGYHQQADWYIDGAEATGIADDPGFLFVFQEKSPPYPVVVVSLDRAAMRVAAQRNRRARALFADCLAHDTWPGHADDGVVTVTLPPWMQEDNDEL